MNKTLKTTWLAAAITIAFVGNSSVPAFCKYPIQIAATDKSSDQSLTTAEYVKLGMPSPEKPWTDKEMSKADTVLQAIAQKNVNQLPRYQSKKSGAVFARLTAAQDAQKWRNKSMPLSERMNGALEYYQGGAKMLKVYVGAFQKDAVNDSDIIELIGSQLKVTVVVLDLVDELMPTIKKSDPKYDARMRGLERMKNGLTSIVNGTLTSLTERKAYRRSELLRLLGYMQQTLPTMFKKLPPSAAHEALAQLDSFQKDPKMQDLQPGLGQLRDKVKATIK